MSLVGGSSGVGVPFTTGSAPLVGERHRGIVDMYVSVVQGEGAYRRGTLFPELHKVDVAALTTQVVLSVLTDGKG